MGKRRNFSLFAIVSRSHAMRFLDNGRRKPVAHTPYMVGEMARLSRKPCEIRGAERVRRIDFSGAASAFFRQGQGAWGFAYRRLRVLSLALLFLAPFIANACADVQITVHFTRVSDDNTRDDVRVYTIGHDHKIHVIATRGNTQTAGFLGLGMQQKEKTQGGIEYTASSKISGGNFIIKSDFATFTVIMTISTDGVKSCKAKREYILKPGQKYFQDGAASKQHSDLHATNLTCEISQT